jgi:hypothetical protein
LTFSIEGLGDFDPATGNIAVNDRGPDGSVVARHLAPGFTSFAAGGHPRGAWALNSSGGPCSIDGAAFCTMPQTGKLTADGWSFFNNAWQGVRTFDFSVGQWNTPDAYAGEVHDPASQMPYMWNRNNPFAYSDPSGYDPLDGMTEAFNKWLTNVMYPGVNGAQSGPLSQRTIEAVKKDQAGELKKGNHSSKLRDGLGGAIKKMEEALDAGRHDIAQKAADTYNNAIARLTAAGADVKEALTGSRGGNGPAVRFPTSISPQEPVEFEPVEVPILIEPLIP